MAFPTPSSIDVPAPYPLVFEPLLLAKVWGGDRLSRFGKQVKPGDRIGESWEVADLASTSASGAGGGAQRSRVVNGALAGRTLHDAITSWGDALLGDAPPSERGGFPLLVKFLDARENLSVQVHPSPSYAAAFPNAHLKTEAWYILDAEPGSVIYKGLRPGVTRRQFEQLVRSGGDVASALVALEAVPGMCHNLPSGTLHALGAGVLVAEVQTPSDTTFRVYDWGRTGRELHIEESMACIDTGPAPAAVDLTRPGARVETEYFGIRLARLSPGERFTMAGDNACTVVMALKGSGSLLTRPAGSAAAQSLLLAAGQTAVLPAALVEGALLEASSAAFEALVATVGACS